MRPCITGTEWRGIRVVRHDALVREEIAESYVRHVSLSNVSQTTQYNSFNWKCCDPEIPQIEKLKFLGTYSN